MKLSQFFCPFSRITWPRRMPFFFWIHIFLEKIRRKLWSFYIFVLFLNIWVHEKQREKVLGQYICKLKLWNWALGGNRVIIAQIYYKLPEIKTSMVKTIKKPTCKGATRSSVKKPEGQVVETRRDTANSRIFHTFGHFWVNGLYSCRS